MIVTLKNSTFTAQIDSLGAQLISLKSADQTEYIWQRDPAYWTNCSPLLFPVVGNCRYGKTMIDGAWYEIPKHGFCKITDFSAKQESETRAVFTICDTAETKQMYPYAFRLSLTYTLTADGISMDYQVENTDKKTIHYELGAHPAFNCPLSEGERFEDYVLEFEKEEPLSSMAYDAESMEFDADRRYPQIVSGRVLPLHYELFARDAIFFDSIASRKVTLKNPAAQKGVEVSFPDFETVAFWTSMPSKGPFLCVEPWNGSAIRSDEDDNFLNRHFLQSLEAGEKKDYHLGIRVL